MQWPSDHKGNRFLLCYVIFYVLTTSFLLFRPPLYPTPRPCCYAFVVIPDLIMVCWWRRDIAALCKCWVQGALALECEWFPDCLLNWDFHHLKMMKISILPSGLTCAFFTIIKKSKLHYLMSREWEQALKIQLEPVLFLRCQPNLLFEWLWFAMDQSRSKWRLCFLSSVAGLSRQSRRIFSCNSSGLLNGNNFNPVC